jgi:hypothetical protein
MTSPTYRIEKNVPLPTRTHGNTKYPFAQMAVGDSFEIEYADRKRYQAAAYHFKKRNPWFSFTIRHNAKSALCLRRIQ